MYTFSSAWTSGISQHSYITSYFLLAVLIIPIGCPIIRIIYLISSFILINTITYVNILINQLEQVQDLVYHSHTSIYRLVLHYSFILVFAFLLHIWYIPTTAPPVDIMCCVFISRVCVFFFLNHMKLLQLKKHRHIYHVLLILLLNCFVCHSQLYDKSCQHHCIVIRYTWYWCLWYWVCAFFDF